MAETNDNIPGLLARLSFNIETLNGTLAAVAQVETPVFSRVSAVGTIAAGARSVSVANVGQQSGTLLGTTLKQNETVTFTASNAINTLAALPYDASNTEFTIARIG